MVECDRSSALASVSGDIDDIAALADADDRAEARASKRDGDNVSGFLMCGSTKNDVVAKRFYQYDDAVLVYICKFCGGDVINGLCMAVGCGKIQTN